jgi:uncharacterized membrane protein
MADVAHAKRVDRLPVITHGKQVAAREQQRGNLFIEVVGVLVLIAQDIVKLILVVLPDLFMVAQQIAGQKQDVVEIDCVGPP